jgi:hypothetical protein
MRRRNAIPRNAQQAQARERALATLALMRREDVPFGKAAKAYGTTPKTVYRYVGSALLQAGHRKRYRATPFDRFARIMNVISPEGSQTRTIRDSRTASRIAAHSNAVKQYLGGRDVSVLKPFIGKSFRVSGMTIRFVTDPTILEHLGDADELPESLYRAGNGGAL